MSNKMSKSEVDKMHWGYINSVTAEYFGSDKLKESQQHTEGGWYWADKHDNYRYSNWYGAYPTREAAIRAGKEYRIDYLNRNGGTNCKLEDE